MPAHHFTSVDVIVRQRGSAYVARAGTGLYAALASSTNSEQLAAHAAAKKFFGGDSERISIRLESPGDISRNLPALYKAQVEPRAA